MSTSTFDAQILQHRFGVLQRNTPFIVVGSLLVAVSVAWILAGSVDATVLHVWLALLLAHSALRVAYWAWLGKRPPDERDVARYIRWHLGLSLASGLLWAGGAMWLFHESPLLEHHLLLTFMLAGMVTSSLHSQTAYLPAFHAFFIPCAVAGVAGNLLIGGRTHDAVALAVFAYCLLAVRFARTLNQNFTEAWRARFEIADLARLLQVQKDAAEAANLAKSRFLAAASHDLRQPVHALSLFIGSLRARPLDTGARELVGHADQAVKSMEAMFGALLDMSRLDAGVVQAEKGPVALRPLLQRLVTELSPQAEMKGLRLRWRGADVWVWSDAVKLERILRNLLVNAIRYTDRGGVLVGCRRRGATCRIQVWDTGCGIAPERQADLFQEFVQLQPAGPQRQGLGLGLAIVKRLSELLEHPVTLASRPGRGSVFSVDVPVSALPDDAVAVVRAPEHVAEPVSGAGRWVLVFDDDAGIRAGLEGLLTGRGFSVVTAADLEEARAPLAGMRVCPALIITDHGLGAALNGVEVIQALRDEFNAEIPAIVVTGNTSPDLLRAIASAGHALLHKPVAAEVLLATIESMILPRPGGVAAASDQAA